MKAEVVWNESMVFVGTAEEHEVLMDAKAPIGKGSAPTPKQLVAFGMGGCTAMDVMALLKKYKQLPDSLKIDIEIVSVAGKQPAVFESAQLTYLVEGQVEPERLIEAVKLSQSKYCSISAMLSKAFPIRYRVELNGKEIASGQAEFESVK